MEVMLNWPTPHSLKALCGFIGLTGYYRLFVANYGTLAWPLMQLLQKNKFHWGPEAEFAFKSLKVAMTHPSPRSSKFLQAFYCRDRCFGYKN